MVWSCGFRSSFSAVPTGKLTDETVDLFLNGHGLADEEVLARWPYDEARSRRSQVEAAEDEQPNRQPNAKRYRDIRQLLRTIGLVYDEGVEGRTVLRVTDLGKALAAWRRNGELNANNVRIIARHASLALSACQLRNPTRDGRAYTADIEVFPFQFIWRAMLALEGRITPDELNRAIYKTRNEADLLEAIEIIRRSRAAHNVELMGPEVVEGAGKNDRVLVWMGWASFGWTLTTGIRQSPNGDSYVIATPWAWRALTAAANIRHRHRDFTTERDYVEHISACAGIPPDLRLG